VNISVRRIPKQVVIFGSAHQPVRSLTTTVRVISLLIEARLTRKLDMIAEFHIYLDFVDCTSIAEKRIVVVRKRDIRALSDQACPLYLDGC
jgi:hypothetical protein